MSIVNKKIFYFTTRVLKYYYRLVAQNSQKNLTIAPAWHKIKHKQNKGIGEDSA
jgi:hypothetical protein